MLFDEANNSLDRQSDDLLTQLLGHLKGKVTLILITYRPSLIALADKVYKVSDGRLVEEQSRPLQRAPAPAAAIVIESEPLRLAKGL